MEKTVDFNNKVVEKAAQNDSLYDRFVLDFDENDDIIEDDEDEEEIFFIEN